MSRESSGAEIGKQTRTEKNESQLSTEHMIEERDEEIEDKEDNHNNSLTRRTRNMENAGTRGRLLGKCNGDAGGT